MWGRLEGKLKHTNMLSQKLGWRTILRMLACALFHRFRTERTELLLRVF
jgi:hypothetical protein